MRFDKFGCAALIIGIILLVGIVHFFFMTTETCGTAGDWCWKGLINAIITTILGGLLLFGVILIIIGILLMIL